MDTFTDYYSVLGVDAHASADAIKAAFKKLALQYHPDIYKGADAEERMRLLLLAYQTLNDPAARKAYDAQRSGYLFDPSGRVRAPGWQPPQGASNTSANSAYRGRPSSAGTGRDQSGPYALPNLDDPLPTTISIDLGDLIYQLAPDEASTLRREGMLRGDDRKSVGAARTGTAGRNYCHRCHHRWRTAEVQSDAPGARNRCPACKAGDWSEYLLLRCLHCHAVFESQEIRDNVLGEGRLYHPYELFPLCPHCRRSQWCPAENTRVQALRAAAARRTTILWISVMIVAVLVLGIMLLTLR